MFPRIFAVVPFAITVTATNAQFTGDYAPETWTVTGAGIGGSSAVFARDRTSLTITGLDGGFGGDIDVTHAVMTGGIWSFDWSFGSNNVSSGFDNPYYLLNGSAVFLSEGSPYRPPPNGSVSIAVAAGDVVGWRVDSVDGIFGAGHLTITDFQIPAPAILPWLGFIGLIQTRRRE